MNIGENCELQNSQAQKTLVNSNQPNISDMRIALLSHGTGSLVAGAVARFEQTQRARFEPGLERIDASTGRAW
jgi:hypothetical protein